MNKIISILLFIIIFSCENKREALGADNEIRVICSRLDREIITAYLSSIFIDTLYTPEPEPYYNLKFSDPETFSQLKSQSQVIVGALKRDNNSGHQLVKKLLPENQFESTLNGDPIILGEDVYAKKQLFMIINANSKEHLMDHVEEKRKQFRKIFNDQFIDRQNRFLFGDDRNMKLEDSLKSEYGWTIKIPWGWDRIKNRPDSNFVWLGREMPFQWIGIGWVKGNVLSNELLVGDYVWKWPKDNYKSIQINTHKFELDKISHGDTFAWRAQGVWETISLKESKGGPFRSYLFYDSLNDLTYHLNFLIHHPGDDKTIFMRQMDMIIKTFKTS
jgi:hypothetical protein|tara:strand:+ start:354 stop:1346 length:993 start_codon:yes stop_codon:yes gene_type:complete